MRTLIFSATARLSALLKKVQVNRFFAIALAGILVFMTSPDLSRSSTSLNNSSRAVTNKIDRVIHQDDSERPKTYREWEQEAERTDGSPVERIKEIGKESADAIQDFGEVYPDVAKRSARTAREQ